MARIKIKCKFCKNNFEVYLSWKNRKYCSKKCYEKSRPRKKIKKRCLICKRIFFAIKDYGAKNQKYCSRKCWKNRPKNYIVKTKCLKCGKIFIAKQNHKNKIQKYCSNSCGNYISAIRSIQISRKNSPYYFINTPFDSKSEMEFAMNLFYQLKIKLIEGKNCHIKIGFKEFDFFIKNTFIEYHPYDRIKTPMEYYEERKEVLNKNGYKKYPLIVIK